MTEPLEPMPDDWERALAIVAHPDDLEYGAAGAVAAWTRAGKQVSYLLVSRGEAGIDGIEPAECGPLREAEQQASAAVVGVHEVEFLDHRDGVIEAGLPLRRDLAAAIRRHRPDLVVTLNYRESWAPGTWNSADHRAVGVSVLDAVADAGNRWIFTDLGLEPWKAKRIAIAGSGQAGHAVDVADTFEDAVASLAEHAAYLRGLGGEGSPEEQARKFLDWVTMMGADRFGGRRCCTFELIG